MITLVLAAEQSQVGDVLLNIGLLGICLALLVMAVGVIRMKVYPGATVLVAFVPVTRERYGRAMVRLSLAVLSIAVAVEVAALIVQQRWALVIPSVLLGSGLLWILWSYWIAAGLIAPTIEKWRNERRMLSSAAARRNGPKRTFRAPS